jgi:hypothetical protein
MISRRIAALMLVVGAMFAASATAASAAVTPVTETLNTSLAPSVPSDPVLHGVTAGGAPWVIKASVFNLLSNGDVQVAIQGLVIPELGTPGPVTSVDAALYCGNETTAAATTKSVPINEQGDALIIDKVKLPASCLTPVVLINPNSIPSIYIATSGFSS